MQGLLLTILVVTITSYTSTAGTYTSKNNCCPGDNKLDGNKCEHNVSINLECSAGLYVLDPLIDPKDAYLINEDYELLIESTTVGTLGTYCLVNHKSDDKYVQIALTCFPEEEMHFEYGMLAIVSSVFLALTLIVYALVPKLRDLEGKCIICLCGSFGLGLLLLSMAQIFSLDTTKGYCVVLAFGIYFWMLSAFFWMNVVAINVARTVILERTKALDRKTFLYYNIYGWGMPTCFLIAAFIAHHADGDHLRPGFGEVTCWFSGKIETWAYFYVPMTILLIINIILFGFTSITLWNKTSYENVTKIRSLKYKFFLYVKLFLVTGLSWIFEILSYAHNKKTVAWMVADIFNALQGLVYFLVLVALRKRALKGLAAIGLPIPCVSKTDDSDEECDEMISEEEASAMNRTNNVRNGGMS